MRDKDSRCHGPNATGNGSQRCDDGLHGLKVDIAPESAGLLVPRGAHVDDDLPGPHEVCAEGSRGTGGGNDDVGGAAGGGEVSRVRVADGHRGVSRQKKRGHGPTDHERATHHGHAGTVEGDSVVIENGKNRLGRAGSKARPPAGQRGEKRERAET